MGFSHALPDQGPAGDSSEDLSRRARYRDIEVREQLDRRPGNTGYKPQGVPHKTTHIGTYPTTAQTYYAVVPLFMLGISAEGAAVDFNVGASPYLAGNVGKAIPDEGTVVFVRRHQGYALFEFNG